ncbi:hypothetical protein AQPW35_04420 [Rubrivivax pictus]|uniref:Uncharacterized protein n=1 Tax=Pseudaquabacterium pictum TaxID=2315236 RepID=A0A480AIE6_9BURK|nr:hypothetical protein AQPW35_04420 [Rubrivivax pictus]
MAGAAGVATAAMRWSGNADAPAGTPASKATLTSVVAANPPSTAWACAPASPPPPPQAAIKPHNPSTSAVVARRAWHPSQRPHVAIVSAPVVWRDANEVKLQPKPSEIPIKGQSLGQGWVRR